MTNKLRPIREVVRGSDYKYAEQKIIDTLMRLKGDIPCEICHLRPATKSLPRGPKHEGHVNVCDDCAVKLYQGGV